MAARTSSSGRTPKRAATTLTSAGFRPKVRELSLPRLDDALCGADPATPSTAAPSADATPSSTASRGGRRDSSSSLSRVGSQMLVKSPSMTRPSRRSQTEMAKTWTFHGHGRKAWAEMEVFDQMESRSSTKGMLNFDSDVESDASPKGPSESLLLPEAEPPADGLARGTPAGGHEAAVEAEAAKYRAPPGYATEAAKSLCDKRLATLFSKKVGSFFSISRQQNQLILQFLRIDCIAGFRQTCVANRRFCTAERSGKLVVPTFYYKVPHLGHVDLPSVETLYADDARLVSRGENEAFVRALGSCVGLQNVYCMRNRMMDIALFANGLAKVPNITVLDLCQNDLALDRRRPDRTLPLESFFLALPTALIVLDLSHNHLQDSHAYQLVEALQSGRGQLRELLLRSNYLGNGAGFAFGRGLMRSEVGAGLQRFDMRTNQVGAEGACAMLSALEVHPRMQEMRVGYNRQNMKIDLATAAQACRLMQKALAATSSNQLRLLDLNNVRIGDEGMARISAALADNELLRCLSIAFNSIGPRGAEALAEALRTNRALEDLDLRDNEVGDEGAEALAHGLLKNFYLKKLHIARNEITDKGFIAFAALTKERPKILVDFGASGSALSHIRHSRRPSIELRNFAV